MEDHMKENKGMIINVGSASIMLVLLVFILSTFAVLSIKASNHELRLAQKTGISVAEYYDADSKAQKVLAQIDQILNGEDKNQIVSKLKNLKSEGLKEINVYGEEEKEPIIITDEEPTEDQITKVEGITYKIAMRGEAVLSVSLEVDEKKNAHVSSWKTIPQPMEGYNIGFETENLWDGRINIEEDGE